MFKRNRKAEAPSPPPQPAPAAAWSGQAFVDRIETLVESGKGEEALDFLLAQLGDLAASGLHRRAKLNHLRFASRLIERVTSAKHGPDKLGRRTRLIAEKMEKAGVTAKGTFLDFGCGRHDPLAIGTVAYANGFDRAIACDVETVENPTYSALSMYEILLDLYRFPQCYLLPGGENATFRRRVQPLPPRPFANRDFEQGMANFAGKVDYRNAELTTLDVADGKLGFAVSFAVLEHVADAADIYRWLFAKAEPGGGQFHFIDLADHRAYGNPKTFDAWSFLTEERDPGNHNRLRAHEHLALIREAGFEIVEEERMREPIPAATRDRLIAPWRDLPEEEIETIGLHLLLRRPA